MVQTTAQHIRKVTWFGLGGNLLLSVFKFVAGTLGNSQAVTVDAVHSLSDSITDIAVIVGSHFWMEPPDEEHPYGHRRIETVVTIFIGCILVGAGIGFAWNALATLHEMSAAPPGWIALTACAVSIVIKEALYQWTFHAGKLAKSPALKANAWHHRLDAFSSLPALLAVGGAILFPEWGFLDLVGAIVISMFIILAGLNIVWPGIQELIDVGAPKDICDLIRNIATTTLQVKKVRRIRTRYVSSGLQADFKIMVDGYLTVHQGHDIAENVRGRILSEVPDVLDVVIHVEPDEEERERINNRTGRPDMAARECPEE